MVGQGRGEARVDLLVHRVPASRQQVKVRQQVDSKCTSGKTSGKTPGETSCRQQVYIRLQMHQAAAYVGAAHSFLSPSDGLGANMPMRFLRCRAKEGAIVRSEKNGRKSWNWKSRLEGVHP